MTLLVNYKTRSWLAIPIAARRVISSCRVLEKVKMIGAIIYKLKEQYHKMPLIGVHDHYNAIPFALKLLHGSRLVQLVFTTGLVVSSAK